MPVFSPSTRVAAVYAGVFTTLGIHVPFFPVFLADRGLVATEIAAIVAVPMVMRVFTSPVLGMIADRAAERAVVLAVYGILAALGFTGFLWADGFWAMMLVAALAAPPWNGLMPVTETIAMALVRRGLGDYGRMRVWGSIGFIAATLSAGLILSRTSAAAVLPLLVCAFWIQAFLVLAAPRLGRAADPTASGIAGGRAAPGSRFVDLVKDSRLMVVLAGAALIQGSHAMSFGFASLNWSGLGYDETAIGVFWAVAVVCEIVIFTFAGRVTARLSPLVLMVVGGTAAVLRWAAFATVSSPAAWMVVQAAHALTFAATHLGTIQFVTRAVPERFSGRLQGLVVTVTGLTMATATFASGPLYNAFGAAGFLAMAGMAAAGTALIMVRLRSAQPQSAGGGGKSSEPS